MLVLQPPAFIYEVFARAASGWRFFHLTNSTSNLTLHVLLGIAGAIVGGVIAGFPEFSALGNYRGLIGALIGLIFFLLGWNQMPRSVR